MNPILNLVRRQNQPVNPLPNNNRDNLQSVVEKIKSGKLDAKQQSFEMLKSLTPQQKVAIRQMIPQIKKLGKAFGVSDDNIDNFINELQTKL